MPEEEIQETQEQEQPQVDPAIMAQAKLFGYKEDYDGNNKLSPEEYVRRAFQRLDIAKGTIGTIERKNAELLKSNEGLQSKLDTLTTGFKQFVENSRKAEERAYERAKKELEAKMEQAVEESDTTAYKKAKVQLDDLEAQIKDHPALTGKEPETITVADNQKTDWYTQDPEGYRRTKAEWQKANPWFGKNIKMTKFAKDADEVFTISEEGLAHKTQQERLDAITEAVKAEFPEYFGEKPVPAPEKPGGNSRRAAAVEEGASEGPPSGGRKKTYADLPADAKIICDQLVREKILTRDDYVNTFQFDD